VQDHNNTRYRDVVKPRRDADPDTKAKEQAHRDRNRELIRAGQRRRADKAKTDNPQARRDAYLRSTYGLSLHDWFELFDKQGAVCALCGGTDPKFKHGWHTDHEHASGRVRGILCKSCNITIGLLGDTTSEIEERCLKILIYLKRA
jgi:hypothetical protein